MLFIFECKKKGENNMEKETKVELIVKIILCISFGVFLGAVMSHLFIPKLVIKKTGHPYAIWIRGEK